MMSAYFRIAAGLLILLRLASAVQAQNAAGPRVEVITAPDMPHAGSVWTMTLLVDHGVPDEVTVRAPSFGERIFPDRILKGPYSAGPAAESGRLWTAVEYRFIVNRPGTITLERFTVITPRGQTRTPPLVIYAQGPQGGTTVRRFNLVWEGLPPALETGEAAALSLRISSRDSPPPLPEPERFMPSVPAGFILESGRLAPDDQAAGIVLRLSVIPLDAAALALPAQSIPFESAIFEVPPLRVPVSPAPQQAGAASPGETARGAEPAANVPAGAAPVPFPDFESLAIRHSILPGLFRDAFANTCATAKNLWDRGYRAESLAELRRNERDHPAAFLFRSVRKTAELSIGLTGTHDEESRYTHIIWSLVCFFLTISTGVVCFMLPLPSWGKKAGLVCAILFTAAGIWRLYRFAAGGEPFLRQSRSGVLKETAARRVPDSEGAVIVHFREGRPIRLSPAAEKTGSWVWVSSYGEDEAAGWVEAKSIVLY